MEDGELVGDSVIDVGDGVGGTAMLAQQRLGKNGDEHPSRPLPQE